MLESRMSENILGQEFDLLVIGAGVNGAGIARDAVERGLKVLLLDKSDFASGCSAHSTRLIHGGLRYLEYLELNLVYESLQERETLLNSYPNLVEPLALMIPYYQTNRVPKFILRLGMVLYDLLSCFKSLKLHKVFSNDFLHEFNAHFNPQGLNGAFMYYDAQVVMAERLILENILTAKAKGAHCYNYCEVTKLHYDPAEQSITNVEFKDLLAAKTHTVRAKNVINVAGPWVDSLNSRLDYTLPKEIGGSKGSHILVKKFPGAPESYGVYLEATSDHRPFFILPFKVAENDTYYLIGTTDILTSEDLDNLKISQEETNYLITEVNRLYPEADLNPSHIVKSFAGIRPLPYVKDASKAASVTRRHFIHHYKKQGIKNYYSIIGGKLTTFRNLSEEVVNLFSKQKSKTKKQSTLGCNYGKPYTEYLFDTSEEFAHDYDIDIKTAEHLIMIYGSKAKQVLELTRENRDWKHRAHSQFMDIEAQIVYAIRHEEARTIEDVLDRRISIGLLTDQHDKDLIANVAGHLSRELNLADDHSSILVEQYFTKKS